MKTYRSTTLRLLSDHCPSALGHYERRTGRDTDIFQTGVAAHAVLQAIGERCSALGRPLNEAEAHAAGQATARALVTTGRSFDGHHEPPMRPEDAFEGRDLALRWHGWDPLSPDASYEIGLAMATDGAPLDYSAEGARYKAILDALELVEVEEEEYAAKVALVTEYKSAWPTDATELDTVQSRGHAVLVAAHHPGVDLIRQRIVNLRTLQTFERELALDDEQAIATLDAWRADIWIACDAADATREARPGAGCIDCPYLLSCPSALAEARLVRRHSKGELDLGSFAATVGVMETWRKALARLFRDASPVPVPGGSLGYHESPRREPAEEAYEHVVREWFGLDGPPLAWPAEPAKALSLLLAMKPGVTALDEVAKRIYPGRENRAAREDLMGILTRQTIRREFGVRKDKQTKKANAA